MKFYTVYYRTSERMEGITLGHFRKFENALAVFNEKAEKIRADLALRGDKHVLRSIPERTI